MDQQQQQTKESSSGRESKDRPKSNLTYYHKGPGPAAYQLPPLVGKENHAVTHIINPEYSFGLKLGSSFVSPTLSPGAADYEIPYGLKNNGYDIGPRFTIRKRFQPKSEGEIPAPGAYDPTLNHKPHAPEYTMRIRHKLLLPFRGNGNYHDLPPMMGPKIINKLAIPEITIKGKWPVKKDANNPGPIYDIRPKKRWPAFTFGHRWPELKSQSGTASPASYQIPKEKVCCTRPSFGRRYNDFTGIFRTPCDRMGHINYD